MYQSYSYAPLTAPSGAPSYDPTHPVADKCVVSGIFPAGTNGINILNGTYGYTVTGSPMPSVAVSGYVGQGALIIGTSAQICLTPISNITANYPVTAACMVHGSTQNTGPGLDYFWTYINNQGGGIRAYGGTFKVGFLVGTDRDTGIPADEGVPYFLAMSADLEQTVCVVRRMDNGKTFFFNSTLSATSSGATVGAFSTGFRVGNGWNVGDGGPGIYSHVMCCNRVFSPMIMKQWAADPWSFWYPGR